MDRYFKVGYCVGPAPAHCNFFRFSIVLKAVHGDAIKDKILPQAMSMRVSFVPSACAPIPKHAMPLNIR